jgi:hypothetical protein
MEHLADILLSIALGLGLAAATGLRVFLPLFLASVLAHFDVGGIGLRENMAWLSSWPAMVALAVATVLELVAYYVPVLDHFLDAIAVPLATVAGTLVAMSTFVDLPPMLAWGLAIIAGGGIAGLVSAGTATTRLASTGTTAGLGNPIVATAETAGSLVLSLLAWFLPLVGLALVVLVLYGVFRLFKRSSAAAKP